MIEILASDLTPIIKQLLERDKLRLSTPPNGIKLGCCGDRLSLAVVMERD